MSQTQLAELPATASLADQREFLQSLIDSKQLPVKTVEEAFTVASYGRELGFGTIASFFYIINVKGKLSLLVKGQKAVLLSRGVTWKTIHDGAYLYSDGSIEKFKIPKDAQVIDMISEVEFRRVINGVTMTETGTFTYRDAQQAGIVDGNPTWAKYTRQMLTARAVSNGAEKIASDLLAGMYTADEMVAVANIPESQIRRNEDGEVEAVIDTTYSEV